MASKRKKFIKKLEEIDSDSFVGEILEVIKYLQRLHAEYEGKYDSLWLEEDTRYEYPGEGSLFYSLHGMRLETDAQYKTRTEKNKLKREKARQTRQKSKEKKFKRLAAEAEKQGYVLQKKEK